MLPDIDKLLELQIADKEIRRLRDEVAALPKRVAVIEQKLAGTKAHLEKARDRGQGRRSQPQEVRRPTSKTCKARSPSIATSPWT